MPPPPRESRPGLLDAQALEPVVTVSEPEARVLARAVPRHRSVLHFRHPRPGRSGTLCRLWECNVLGTWSWMPGF